MKKSFRNRLLAVTAVAASSFLLLSGFDSALTAEDVSEKTTAAIAEMGGLNCDVKGTADISIDIAAGGETQSLPITGSMDYSVQLLEDPLVMAVSGSMNGDASAMGMAGGMSFEMYLTGQDDGTGVTYIRLLEGDDTAWHAAEVTAEDMTKISGSVKASLSGDPAAATAQLGVDLSSIKDKIAANAVLTPEAVNVNGVDCYEITQTIDGDTLFAIISEVVKAMPEAGIDDTTLSYFQMLFAGIKMDAISDSSVETFAPVYASIDLSGSDFSMIGQMFGAMMGGEDASQSADISVNVNALNLAMTYGDVPAQIDIPAEALAAEVETTLSMNDVSQAAEALE